MGAFGGYRGKGEESQAPLTETLLLSAGILFGIKTIDSKCPVPTE